MKREGLYNITEIVPKTTLNDIEQEIFNLKTANFIALYTTPSNYWNTSESKCREFFKEDVERYRKAINQFIDLQLKIHN